MMVNKVELCGVNTSKLPLLKEDEKEKLFAQREKVRYTPKMPEGERQQKLHDWNRAVELLLR